MLSYTLHRSLRRKRSVALNVKADGSLHVLAPMRTSVKWIESFIAARQRWIQKRRDEVKIADQVKKMPLAHGSEVFFLGEKYMIQLHLFQDSPSCEKGKGTNDQGRFIPLAVHAESQSAEDIDLALRLWYKKQARLYFQERATYWAKIMRLVPKRIMVAAPKRQWGSCSADNVIRLNWRLMIMPKEIVDYVIVHELAHITHKNHGERFWNLVGKYVPSYKLQRGILRQWEKSHPLPSAST